MSTKNTETVDDKFFKEMEILLKNNIKNRNLDIDNEIIEELNRAFCEHLLKTIKTYESDQDKKEIPNNLKLK